MDFVVPADHRIKLKESEMRDKYLDLSRKLKKLWNSNNYTNRDLCFWYSHKTIIKGTGGLGNKKTSRDYPND